MGAARGGRQTREWLAGGSSAGVVSVNLLARQFRQEGLVRHGVAHLEETKLGARAARDGAREHGDAQRRGGDRHAAGDEVPRVGLSVDDSAGYSSLSYLRTCRSTALKIDRSFVRDIGAGGLAEDGVIAQAIIRSATACTSRWWPRA